MILAIEIRNGGANGHNYHNNLFLFSVARRKLDQVENGSYDKEVSSMGSRSSSSGKKLLVSVVI